MKRMPYQLSRSRPGPVPAPAPTCGPAVDAAR